MWFHWMQDPSLDGHNWHIVKKWKKKKNIDGIVLFKHAKTLALQWPCHLNCEILNICQNKVFNEIPK